MRNELLAPLQNILDATTYLIEDPSLNMLQGKFAQSIHDVGQQMFDLVVIIPDLTWERAREVLSYEARSHLSSIIGYAEVLLDETDGPLNREQKQHVESIRAAGKQLLARVSGLWD